jgi:hypothetical protein
MPNDKKLAGIRVSELRLRADYKVLREALDDLIRHPAAHEYQAGLVYATWKTIRELEEEFNSDPSAIPPTEVGS